MYVQGANSHLIQVLTMVRLPMAHIGLWLTHLLPPQLIFLYLVPRHGLKHQTIVLILKAMFLMVVLVVVVCLHQGQRPIIQVLILYESMYHILHLPQLRTRTIFLAPFLGLQKRIESAYVLILIKLLQLNTLSHFLQIVQSLNQI